KPARIGLWDQYGGSMPSGWIRWMFEQYEFPFEVVYPRTLDAGNLSATYDVLVFVSGAIPASGPAAGGGRGGDSGELAGRQPDAQTIPAEFRERLGQVTAAQTVPQLKKFLDEGGTVLTIGTSTAMGYHVGLPIKNALVERVQNFAERPLPAEKFYVPGAILEARVDNTNPLAYGLEDRVMVFFDHSPAFLLEPQAALRGGGAVCRPEAARTGCKLSAAVTA